MNKNNFFFILVLCATIIGAGYLFFGRNEKRSTSDLYKNTLQSTAPIPTMEAKKLDKPTLTIDQKKSYTAVLHTSDGDITITFDVKNAPITVNNFVYLSKNHFYDNTIFHRTIDGFMIQGGDPTGTGMGGPGYKFDDEYLKGTYTRGVVAMANSGANTNGSQFFIMQGDVSLDNAYVIFGKVTKGLEVVDKIVSHETTNQPGTNERSKPITPARILSVDILEK